MSPVESKDFSGFYEIPNFSNYCISKKSEIFLKTKKKLINQYKVKGSASSKKDTGTYLRVTMYDDNKKLKAMLVHRLMGIVFKYPKEGINGLQVNHINGIKNDNSLNNLEWVTCKKNIKLSNLYYGSKIKIPMQIKNVFTKEIVNFKNISDGAKFLGIHRNTMISRLEKTRQGFVFPGGYMVRYGNSDSHWIESKTIEKDIETFKSQPLLLKDLNTKIVTEVSNLKEAMTYIALGASSINIASNNPSQPSVWGKNGHVYIIIKKYPKVRFRNVSDPYKDIIEQNKAIKPVFAINTITNEKRQYESIVQCASDFGLLKTTLFWRLKKKQPRSYNGWIFRYM